MHSAFLVLFSSELKLIWKPKLNKKKHLLNLSDQKKPFVYLSLSTVYLMTTVMTMVKNTNTGAAESSAFLRYYYNQTLVCNI